MSQLVPAHLSPRPHEELRELLAVIVPEHRARFGAHGSWEAWIDFQRTLGRHGWTAPAWPADIGGRGLDVAEQVACDAEFHRAGAPRQVAVFGVKNVGPTIAVHGTPEQRLSLGRILTAEEVWCQGFSEPDAGSDLAGLRCRAELDGDTWIVNGSKVWTSIGMWATHCMLLVRTDLVAPAHKGISALMVPLDLPGIERRPITQISGDSDFAEMHFTDVHVPADSVLGAVNDGWRVTMATLGFERAGVISIAGNLVEDVERLVLGDRGTGGSRGGSGGPGGAPGRPGGLVGVHRQEASRLYSGSRILQWMGSRALAEMTGAAAPGAVSSVIKLAWSILAQRLAELGASTVGLEAIAGLSTDDMAAGNRLIASRSMTIAGGTTEIMKNVIGERSLGLPREPRP